MSKEGQENQGRVVYLFFKRSLLFNCRKDMCLLVDLPLLTSVGYLLRPAMVAGSGNTEVGCLSLAQSHLMEDRQTVMRMHKKGSQPRWK